MPARAQVSDRDAAKEHGMLVIVGTVCLTKRQAEQALALSDAIRSRPGMWIARFSWYTANAFWSGYLHALHEDALHDFRTWGLAHLNAPGSNTDPIIHLARLHGVPSDDAPGAGQTRERDIEVAGHVCDLIEAYIRARRAPSG